MDGSTGRRDSSGVRTASWSTSPESVTRFLLFTGSGSEANLRRYRRSGYRQAGTLSGDPADTRSPVLLVKNRRK